MKVKTGQTEERKQCVTEVTLEVGNYEHPFIVTIKITSVTTVAKSFYFVINQIQVTSNK